MVPRVRQNARQRVELDNHRTTAGVAPHIDAAPVAAFQGVVGSEGSGPNFLGEILRDTGGTFINVERIARRVPDPLSLIAINRWRTLGQCIKSHADNRQTASFLTVAENGDG